jgi:hypothetical protein
MVQDNYSPKWQLEYDPINFRILPGFMNQAMGFTGTLYWNVASYQDGQDPWVKQEWLHSEKYYNCDGVFVYPGAYAGLLGVAPSIRLKWVRDGVQDYEYIQILKGLGKQVEAMEIVNTVATDWTIWTKDSLVLENAKRKLGELIVETLKRYQRD